LGPLIGPTCAPLGDFTQNIGRFKLNMSSGVVPC
jgi:hypothetical protein